MLTYPFGREKGKPLTEVGTESLMYLIGRCSESNDPKYAKKNQETIAECNRIINERTDASIKKKPSKSTPSTAQQASFTVDMGILQRIEKKLDSVITHLGLDQVDADESAENGSPF